MCQSSKRGIHFCTRCRYTIGCIAIVRSSSATSHILLTMSERRFPQMFLHIMRNDIFYKELNDRHSCQSWGFPVWLSPCIAALRCCFPAACGGLFEWKIQHVAIGIRTFISQPNQTKPKPRVYVYGLYGVGFKPRVRSPGSMNGCGAPPLA